VVWGKGAAAGNGGDSRVLIGFMLLREKYLSFRERWFMANPICYHMRIV
jgi:hypothetical protein